MTLYPVTSPAYLPQDGPSDAVSSALTPSNRYAPGLANAEAIAYRYAKQISAEIEGIFLQMPMRDVDGAVRVVRTFEHEYLTEEELGPSPKDTNECLLYRDANGQNKLTALRPYIYGDDTPEGTLIFHCRDANGEPKAYEPPQLFEFFSLKRWAELTVEVGDPSPTQWPYWSASGSSSPPPIGVPDGNIFDAYSDAQSNRDAETSPSFFLAYPVAEGRFTVNYEFVSGIYPIDRFYSFYGVDLFESYYPKTPADQGYSNDVIPRHVGYTPVYYIYAACGNSDRGPLATPQYIDGWNYVSTEGDEQSLCTIKVGGTEQTQGVLISGDYMPGGSTLLQEFQDIIGTENVGTYFGDVFLDSLDEKKLLTASTSIELRIPSDFPDYFREPTKDEVNALQHDARISCILIGFMLQKYEYDPLPE